MKKISLMIVCLFAMMAASTGLKAQEVTILLRPGWNWIGYPYPETVDLETAFGDFEPLPGDVIESNYEYSEYLSVYGWFGGVNELHPGWGYMYFSNRTEVVSVVLSAPASQSIVTTGDPTDITTNSATSGGSITTDAYVFAKGICWAAHSDPTPMDDNHSESGGGDESFTAEMTELSQNTMYYVRAYVVTQDGITYGNELSFTTIPIWTIEATPNPTDGGTITGAGDYEQNAICNLTAIANEGYIFANWTENGEVVSTDATYTFTVDAARTLVANFDLDHTYVDLGLPSGTLWATCNLGANLPEEYGDYFAWGETQPKDTYDWSTYQYCNGSDITMTKYCSNPEYGYNGFTDNLTTLLPEDDAATVNWGDNWRMPTKEEWQELYQNTTHIWTTQNGVNGRLFTASNGNSLFLPAAGYRENSSSGRRADYWSSSLYTNYPNRAWLIYFISDNFAIVNDARKYGQSVRAVRSSGQNMSFIIDATASPTEGGTVSGSGTYQEGTECTLTATPSENYTFSNWTENGEVVSTDAIYSFTVNADRTLVANFAVSGGDHAYVDLGLPSGLLWATCNVGADNPEDYGDYFAWGETQPKSVYTWSTYQYCNGSSSTFTKYCNNSSYGYNGFTDNLTTLLPEDDAATANWGSDWRMPTEEEWQELYNNTTHTWTTQNGVNGRLFTASNGSSLFLPAAGCRNGSGLGSAGSWGYYWSSSLGTDSPYNAWGFYFNSDSFFVGSSYRYYGQSVRAVRVGSQNTAPTGAINGKFTINTSGDQVYFSQGNLQYIGSAATPYWKFADNQWDILGTTTGQNSSDENVDRDLFGWGTSGWNNGNTYYQPWSTAGSEESNYGQLYGPSGQYNLTGTYANADWGVYNPISNGGNQANQWRTLTNPEWAYVFDTRTTSSGIRYAKANVNNVNGVILLPDDWSSDTYSLSNTNSAGASFSSNTISALQWNTLEQVGAVFLPAAGKRDGTSVGSVGSYGSYWSASYFNSLSAYYVHFFDSLLFTDYNYWRDSGRSIRLVRVAE